MLIETLILLALVQLIAGAMISMAVARASGIPGSSLEEAIVRVIITIASLAIPFIASMFIGRSGLAEFAASALLGYAVFPAFHALRGYLMGSMGGGRGAIRWGIGLGIGTTGYINRGVIALPKLPRIIRTRYESYQFTGQRDKGFYNDYEY